MRACEICIFPGEGPVVFIKFSKRSLTQKRFRRLKSTALKGAFVSVKLAKFQPKVGQSDQKPKKVKRWAVQSIRFQGSENKPSEAINDAKRFQETGKPGRDGGGAAGEEWAKEPGAVERTKEEAAQGSAAIPLQRRTSSSSFIRWAPRQLVDTTHQVLFLLKRTEKKCVYSTEVLATPLGPTC